MLLLLCQMVVNYASSKEQMRRHGDQLDAKLRKATIELHALSNTLTVVKQRNHAQRLGRDIKPTCQHRHYYYYYYH